MARPPLTSALLAVLAGAVAIAAVAGNARAQDAGAPTDPLALRGLSSDDATAGGAPPPPRKNRTEPNYGKPQPQPDPTLAYPGRHRKPAHALPDPQPYTTAPKATRATPFPDDLPPTDVASPPLIPVKPKPKVEDDAFAPVGISVGSLRLVPSLDVESGYDSNPQQTQLGAKGSAVTRAQGEVTLRSDWNVHELTGDLRTGYTKFWTDQADSRPDGAGKLDLRLDATRDLAIDFELRGTLDTQRPGSPNLLATNVTQRPLVLSYGGTAGVTDHINRLELGLHGLVDRTVYQDATLSGGTTVPLSDDNFTAYGLQARVGYEITPGLKPFGDATVDTRRHDEAVDSSGYARDSNGYKARVGADFELTRLLTGEAAVGYAARDYADPRLKRLAAPTLDAALIWTATPLTTVTLRSTTDLAETTVAGSPGAVTRTASLEVSHALMRNVQLGAIASFGVNNYVGVPITERTYSGALNAEYKLSRSISVKGSFTHTRLQSTVAGSSYTDNTLLVGLKLQR